jgi:hypothetical protein
MYVDVITWHRRNVFKRNMTLDELDEVIEVGTRRRVPTTEVVEEALRMARSIAQSCVDEGGIDISRYVELIFKRAHFAKQKNASIDEALMFVGQELVKMLSDVAVHD